jgi:Aldehyde dehydrogenase family
MPTATIEMNNPQTRNYVAVKRKLLIDGKWVDAQSGETFPVYNPATGEVMDKCAAGDKADIDLAVKAARRAFEGGAWPRLTHGQRGKLIWKLADLIEEHLEEFAQIESLDNGKPLAVARVADVPLAVEPRIFCGTDSAHWGPSGDDRGVTCENALPRESIAQRSQRPQRGLRRRTKGAQWTPWSQVRETHDQEKASHGGHRG